MRYLNLLLLIPLFFNSCTGPEETSDQIETITPTDYCDCNELAFDQAYNRFYLDNQKEGFTGLCEVFYANGNLSLSKNFKNGKVHGALTSYYENGQVEGTKFFDMNLQTGEYLKYAEDGTLIYHARYKRGTQVETIYLNTDF